MIDSRDMKELLPNVQHAAGIFFAHAKGLGIDLLVTSTYRDFACQSALYDRGRTTPGHIVTNARPGQSWHNWRRAFDIVPLRHGKPVWDTAGTDGDLWRRLGELGEQCGLEWAGHWTRFPEFPHFQITDGITLEQMLKRYPGGLK